MSNEHWMERERERECKRKTIYIYIYRERETEKTGEERERPVSRVNGVMNYVFQVCLSMQPKPNGQAI